MKRSTDRILTTHAGRLDGPPEYRELMTAMMSGKETDPGAPGPRIQNAMVDVLRKQSDAGIDIVSDGELGKIAFGKAYYGPRLSGLTSRPLQPGEPAFTTFQTGERREFEDFYKDLAFVPTPPERTVCSGPIRYTGSAEIRKDLDLFRAALLESGIRPEETFLCVMAPGWLEHFFLNEHYGTEEEYVFALAEAMAHEYKAVVDAGFVLQIDDPALPDTYDMISPAPTIEE